MNSTAFPPLVSSAVNAPGDEAHLKARARRFVSAYPDLHDMAYAAARKILLKHTNKQLNPEQVFWHRFSGASNSSRSFTGWQHAGPPVESMTLIELVMHRFNAHDQEATDDLNLYSGFYTVDGHHNYFDDSNEVPMLPSRVLEDFWALNVSADFNNKMERFWADHSEDFRVLSKVTLLAAAGECRRTGALSGADANAVIQAVTGKPEQTTTLDLLQAPVMPASGVTFRAFDIGGVVASDMLRIVEASGRQIVYVPGEPTALHAFASEQALYQWVQACLKSPESKATLTSHFLRSPAEREQTGAAFEAHVVHIVDHAWSAEQKVINQNDVVIGGDPFAHLCKIAQQEMQSDADVLLRSNAQLRKQMWLGYLSAFTQIAGGLAPLAWPMALTLVGATVASIGLNIDQAVNGASARQRKAGVTGAIVNSIYLVFSLPLLAEAKGAVELQPVADTASEVLAEVAEPIGYSTQIGTDSSLHALQGNEILDGVPRAETGRLRGIHLLDNGETWIEMEGLSYRVRLDETLGCWVIVDPANPYAFTGAKPVRLTDQGDWVLGATPGLQGGRPMLEAAQALPADAQSEKSYPTVSSTFWDTHMQMNLPEERRLSEQALERQKQVVDIYELYTDDEINTDSEGDDVHVDVWGDKHRVFESDGFYSGGNIEHYTQKDVAYNQFLRTGEAFGSDQVKMLEKLVADVGQVAKNNDVALYRGGSRARGTSGLVFRNGQIKPGDVLVNTDITSLSENPYVARTFCSSQEGESAEDVREAITFDDSAVVFVLPEKNYVGATPITPFSRTDGEAESIFLPGHYFKIDSLEEVAGANYRFMKVQLREVSKPEGSNVIYDMRSGQPFSREHYAKMLGNEAKGLVDTFFPLPHDA